MLKHNPDTLVNYATRAYGDYVRSLCRQWLPCFQHDTSITEETADLKCVEYICERLRNMLACTLLPSQVANVVTLKLLRHVDTLFDFDYLSINSGKHDDLVISNIVSVLIHPSVTEINLGDCVPCFDWFLLNDYVYQNLSQLRFLKVLNLRGVRFALETNISQNLLELTVSDVCGPMIINNASILQFGNLCGNLRKIEIRDSTLDDMGLKILLKLTQLEHLEFKEVKFFSATGMTQLLKGLAKNTDATGTPVLKKFKCLDLTPEQIDFVVHTFDLVSFCVEEPVKDIHHLSHLRSLSIHGEISSINITLLAVGHQLLHLKLKCVDSVDLCVVAECCPLLVSLKVSLYKGDMLNDPEVSLPTFSNLKIVDISSSCPELLTCILTNCTNVKVLKLDYWYSFAEAKIADVLQKNPLRHIEELEVIAWLSNLDIKFCNIAKLCIVIFGNKNTSTSLF